MSCESTVVKLTAIELRVLACLVEKSYTTPDQYPLSSNSLTAACNQKTSRDPVVDYSTRQVDETLQLLRDAGWVLMERGRGDRAFKHRHQIEDKLGLTVPEQAVLAVLALRGPQSPGELKTRTDRYHQFEDLAAVERVLGALSGGEQPLVRNVGRSPGQSQDRWVQLIGDHEGEHAAPAPEPGPARDTRSFEDTGSITDTGSFAATGSPVPEARQAVAATGADGGAGPLEARLAQLERRVAELEERLARGDRPV